jgi:polyphenol oxidase
VSARDIELTALDGSITCALPGAGRALFTSRARGNLSTLRGDGHEGGRRARDELCEDLGLRWLCASRQVHGATVQRVQRLAGTAGQPLSIDADGHATSMREVGVTVLVADCVPVALGCESAVAMLHAGWRGLAAGVLEQGVRALQEVSSRREPVVAVMGPGAGVCCYEVGREVHAALGRAHGADGRIDLRSIARERLLGAGVADVLDAGVCTICDERFFSHRREGARAGRQAGVAWLS